MVGTRPKDRWRSADMSRRWKHSGTRKTYTTWVNMRLRCFSEKHPLYPLYGARGITVCERWRDDYDAFYEDMGPRPEKTTIDRINNDGNYEPGNCRWVPMSVQNRNNRRTHFVEFRGKKQSLTDWAQEFGFTPNGMRRRLKNYPIEIALSHELLAPEWKSRK